MFVPDREELAWAAGFFDGEGTTHLAMAPASRYSPDRRCGFPRLSVAQISVETLDRFRTAVGGIGGIYGRQRSNVHSWQTGSVKQAYFVIGLLWFKLTPIKQEQARASFLRYKEQLMTKPKPPASSYPRWRRDEHGCHISNKTGAGCIEKIQKGV